MSRYIDADALKERLEDFSKWCRDGRKQGVDFVLDCPLPNMPTADVAPRAEVENFNKSKGGFCPLCGSYTITQEMMEELRMAHKEQGQHGDPVGEKGVNALEAIKAVVAREIFEEIEKIIKGPFAVGFCMTASSFRQAISDYNEDIRKEILYYIAELKKKYTEAETPEES